MWNQSRYEKLRENYQRLIDNKTKKPYDLMLEYKDMVNIEDYESCKAITEVLKPLNYDTADTHKYIPRLNEKTITQ